MKLDSSDIALLNCLQTNGRISNQQLAEDLKLSAAPCWRRMRKLEESGFVKRYAALLDREKIGLDVMAYIHISLCDHHAETVADFDAFVNRSPEILECYSVSGEYDYLIRVVAKNMLGLEQFLMQRLLKESSVDSANTSFVLREKKYTTVLPLE